MPLTELGKIWMKGSSGQGQISFITKIILFRPEKGVPVSAGPKTIWQKVQSVNDHLMGMF